MRFITQTKLVSLCELSFFQPKSQKLVFILKVFNLINTQLLSAANAKDINTDYYIMNSVEVGKETRNKIRGFEIRQTRMLLMNFS